VFFFFRSTEVWTQGLHLEPLLQPFFLWKFFFEVGSYRLFAQLSLNCSPPDFCLLSRITGVSHQHPAVIFFFFFFEIGSHYLPRLASNHDPPDLCLLSG
jgi:hypothetical protein